MTCKKKGGALSVRGFSKKWYAVQTRSNFEKTVCAELTKKGLENYCPVVREVHQWADRKKTVELPLFPGYVFTRFEDTGSVRRTVLQTIGTVRILGTQDRIEAVPDAEIESLQKLLRVRPKCAHHPFVREGVRARVKRGALKGVEGTLVNVENQARLVLSISLFCRSVSTEVNVGDIEILAGASLNAFEERTLKATADLLLRTNRKR